MWQALVTAQEYGVQHTLRFGLDHPSGHPSDVIAGPHTVNDLVDGTKLPHVSDKTIHRHHAAVFPEWA